MDLPLPYSVAAYVLLILVLAAGPQFEHPINALDVPIIGVMLVFGYFFIKDNKSKRQ
ncbi:hypothetical protein [Lactiplantibacillus pentosus]